MNRKALAVPALVLSLVSALPATPTSARGAETSDTTIAASEVDLRTREVGFDVFPFASLDPGSDADTIGTYGAGSIWVMRDSTHGQEPYYATSDGVTMLDDINPYGDSEVDHGLEHQGYFYFDANDGVHGEELWRTDGTTTELVADINPDGSSDPQPLLSVGDTLYLSAITTDTGRELFRLVDGEVELAADTYPGPEDGNPEMVAFGDLFAVEHTNASGTQFRLFDGTNIVDVPAAAAAYSITSISDFIGNGDRLYIIADNVADGREVYSTDGTDFRQHEVNPSGTSSAQYLTALGDSVVFRADDGTHGEELFMLDVATSDTPVLTGDINSTGSDGSSPAYLAALGDTVYFRATDGSGYEPWKYTPGSAPQRVADINPGGATTLTEFVGTQDLVYFPANDGSGWKLYEDRSGVVSDIIASTTPTPSVEYGAARRDIIPTADGTAIVFVGTTDDEGSELWWADAGGVRPLGDVQTEYNTSDHEFLTVLGTIGDTTVIAADDGTGTYSYQWYSITDGVATAIPGTAAIAGDALGSWTAWNDTIVVGSGRSIWVYDGTTLNEYTISPAATNAGAYGFVPHDGVLYFAADDQTNGLELWSFDGSAVAQVADIDPGGDASNPTQLHSHGDYLYFAANNGTDGRELYRTDGTTTELVEDIDPFGTSVPEFLASYGNELLFVADDGTNGAEPWVVRADGTVEMLANLDGAATDSIPSVTEFVTARGNAYFYSFDASAQAATLWEYDGTDVTEVETFPTYPTIPMVAVDDDLIFLALDAAEGRELHRIGTDGVEVISDLEPGTDGTGYIELVEVGGQIRINDGLRLMSYTQADGLEVVTRYVGNPVSYFLTLNDEAVNVGLSTGPYNAEAAELGFVPAAPGDLTVDGAGDTATITWAAPSDPGSAAVTDYDITATGGTLDCDEAARECTWTGLDPAAPDTVSITASNRFGRSAAATATSSGEVFITVTPGRVVDTRFGDPKVDGVERFQIAGAEVVGDPARTGELIGVPVGAEAVAINVTVTGTEAPGFVSVYPCSSTSDPTPNVSNVNYVAGATVANSAVVPLSDDGYLCVSAVGATHVLIDVAGYFVSGLTTVDPGRVVDTRFAGAKVDGTERFQIADADVIGDPSRTGESIGVPVGADAVALNLTVTGTEAPGFVSVYPCDATSDATPNVSNVNYAANATVANSAVVPLSDDGYLCVTSVGATHVLIDVAGYFESGLNTVNPGRVVETRFGDPKVDGVTRFQIAGAEVVGDPARTGESIGVPVDATAVAINVTVTGTEAPGFVSVYPCSSESTTPPNVSNVNYVANTTVANSAIVPLDTGYLCVKAEGATHVLIDVAGHL